MTKNPPVSTSSPVTTAAADRAAWQALARRMIRRLRDQMGEGREGGDDAVLFDDGEDDIAALPSTSGATSRALLMVLRLAASFGSQTAVNALIKPGAITLLRGIEADALPVLRHVLSCLRPTTWQIVEQMQDEVFPPKPLGPFALRLVTVSWQARRHDQATSSSEVRGNRSGSQQIPLIHPPSGHADPHGRRLSVHSRLHPVLVEPIDLNESRQMLGQHRKIGSTRRGRSLGRPS